MDIYLIRHGETDWNREGRRQGQTDIPLNDTGRAQGRQTAALLGQLCPEVSHVFVSPLSRAVETARIVADQLGWDTRILQTEPLLIERHFGLTEGLSPQERTERFPDEQNAQMEPMEDFLGRIKAACEKILREADGAQNILVVSHYMALSAMIGILTEGKVVHTPIEQGCVYRIVYGDTAQRVTRFSQKEYL